MADYIVVQADQAQTKTASGLYIPGNAQEKPKTAQVLAVGDGVKAVKVGDRVIYKNEYEATTVKVGKEEYTLVYHANIIATVK
jgi:chaperonin GroES